MHPAPTHVAADDGIYGRAPGPQSPSLECCVLLQPKHQPLCGGAPPVQVLTGPETQGQLGTQTQKQWPMTRTHTCHPAVQRSPKSARPGPRLRHLSWHPFLPASLPTPTRIPCAMPPTCHNPSGVMAQCKASVGNPGHCWPFPCLDSLGYFIVIKHTANIKPQPHCPQPHSVQGPIQCFVHISSQKLTEMPTASPQDSRLPGSLL